MPFIDTFFFFTIPRSRCKTKVNHVKSESVKLSNWSHLYSPPGCRLTQLKGSLWISQKEGLERIEFRVPVYPGFSRLWTGGIVGVNEARRSPQPQVEKLRWGRIKGTSQPRLLLRPDSGKELNTLICCRGLSRKPSTKLNLMSIYCTTKQENGKQKWAMLLSLLASNPRLPTAGKH